MPAPPRHPDTAAPFRAPGLPVGGPRRAPAAVRVLQAGWDAARARLADGAAALREVPSPRLVFRVEVDRAVHDLWAAALVIVVVLVLVRLGLFVAGLVVRYPGIDATGPSVDDALVECVVSLAVVLALFAGLVAAAVTMCGAVGAARVAAGAVWIALTSGASAALVFVGAAAREVGREVARRAYDARVRRR